MGVQNNHTKRSEESWLLKFQTGIKASSECGCPLSMPWELETELKSNTLISPVEKCPRQDSTQAVSWLQLTALPRPTVTARTATGSSENCSIVKTGCKRGYSWNYGAQKEGGIVKVITIIKEKAHTLHGDCRQASPRKETTNRRLQLIKTQIHSRQVSLYSECRWRSFLLENGLESVSPRVWTQRPL